jgi:Phosphotransferase enzyme family
VHPMRHGYTNDTRGDNAVVIKQYVGPAAAARHDRERSMLQRLHGALPVPTIIDSTPDLAPHRALDGALDRVPDDGRSLWMSHLGGVHGQELIDDGRARSVLRSCGVMLRHMQSVPVSLVLPDVDHAPGAVLVHGDYGPNNMLFDPRTVVVTGLLDWEWAHVGGAIEDVAWCEWIVRMHHPGEADALNELFDAYGERPPWSERQTEMIRRCQELADIPRPQSDPSDMAIELWRQRVRVTESWLE